MEGKYFEGKERIMQGKGRLKEQVRNSEAGTKEKA